MDVVRAGWSLVSQACNGLVDGSLRGLWELVVLFFAILLLAILMGVVAWLLATVRCEPVLGVPVVVVESDDWGPGPPEDGRMLAQIHQALRGIRDISGRPAVMTLGMVLGVPDGAAILATGCRVYARLTLENPQFAPIVESIRKGCQEGVFALQRHGLEHCWPVALLARARTDAEVLSWLGQKDARSEELPAALQSRWVNAARLPSQPLDGEEIRQAISEEDFLFKRLFGAAPEVAVPNTFVWNDEVEKAWSETGVACVVTPGARYTGRDAKGDILPAVQTIRNGQRGQGGIVYVVRNDYFEPARGHRAERVWDSVTAKTLLGCPSLFETHRDNFIGEEAKALASLRELERALRGVLARHPDVRFMTTIELARQLEDPASPLLERGRARRWAVYFRRTQRLLAGRRLVKYSGLGMLLGWLERAVTAVKGDRQTAREV